MKRALAIGLVGLGMAAPAQAQTVIETEGARPYQEWVDRAQVPTPNATIRVIETIAPCSGAVLGCTDRQTWIALQPDAPPKTMMHELGHVFDWYALTADDRGAFLGIVRRSVWPGDGEEWFAGAYQLCARTNGEVPRRKRFTVGNGLLRGWRLSRACDLIRLAGGQQDPGGNGQISAQGIR